MVYNKLRLLSCLICLARISLRKMTEGNIEQHVLQSATYDEDMVGYPEDTDPVGEGYRENHRHPQRREHPSLFPSKTTR